MRFMYFLCMVHLSFGLSTLPPTQDFEDRADLAPEDDKSISTHPYVVLGLPIGTWKISSLNSTEKETICNKQTPACRRECGGEQFISKNFCNKTSMAWGCECKNHVPVTPPYSWPIVVAECQGKEKACNDACTYEVTKSLCLQGCFKYYKCNQSGSPPSGLNVENEYDAPHYNLPISEEATFHTSFSTPLSPSSYLYVPYTIVLTYISCILLFFFYY